DTLMLHGITMTGAGEMVLWQPDTLRVILAVRRLREQGVPAFFSIDTGATVYVNTFPDRAEQVRRAIADLGIETIPCTVGGPARVVEEAQIGRASCREGVRGAAEDASKRKG